jgi:hypothetical protein
VFEPNITPWRRAVVGDLTSLFNFAHPDRHTRVNLPNTDSFLPSVNELAGGNVNTFIPDMGSVIIGIPQQETGVRPARALPYTLNVHAVVSGSTVTLTFYNTGAATVVFEVCSGNVADNVRTYTVSLASNWPIRGTRFLRTIFQCMVPTASSASSREALAQAPQCWMWSRTTAGTRASTIAWPATSKPERKASQIRRWEDWLLSRADLRAGYGRLTVFVLREQT